MPTKEEMLEDMQQTARKLLEKEEKDGVEAYHIVRRLSRFAGFTADGKDFKKAADFLERPECNRGWRDEIIGKMAVSYARAGDYDKALKWAGELFFTDERDKVRLAIIDLMMIDGRRKPAESLLDGFQKSSSLIKALIAIGEKTGEIKYFKRAYKTTLLNEDIEFDRIETLMNIMEALDRTTIQK